MTDSDSTERLRKELRYLKIYAGLCSVFLVVLVVAAFRPGSQSFDEIDVQRINVRHADGALALAISGQGRLPGPTFEGREYPQELSGGRTTASGMIFFNERGDEVGGLTYQGQIQGEGYRASGGITFDQFQQDQVVSLQYSDDGVRRSAGVNVWDRSTEIGIAEILDIVDARAEATGAQRDSIEQVIQGMADQGLAAHRLFIGSQNRTAGVNIQDTRGRTRIRMYVDSLDVARLEFMDSTGVVTRSWPE